jgi:hypothetical protein
MKRSIVVAVFVVVLLTIMALPAFATIHPIVESFDCANAQAFEHHPLGDPADPPGQTPGYGQHSEQSTFRALQEANANAFFGHKLDGECGGGS